MWIKDNIVFRNYSEIRSHLEAQDSPVSLPALITEELVTELGFNPVTMISPQFDTLTQAATELAPEMIEGVWTQVWLIEDLDASEADINIVAARRAKDLEINAWRTAANLSTFPYADKQVACDALSRSDIDAVAGHISLFGALPPDFPGAWKATDNSYIPLPDVDCFKRMYQAMTTQGTVNFARSQQLKAMVASATTSAQIRAITWEGAA